MLYICYGAKKSGSTLTYSLTKALLQEAGHPHIALSSEERRDVRGNGDASNTVRNWSEEVVDAALKTIPSHHIVAFRTHTGPSKAIAAAVHSGLAKVQICVRDPRDLALSMWDVLKRHRSWGRERHRSLDSLPDILRHVERNLQFTFAWAELGAPLVLNYEQTAFNPEASMSAICNDLDLELAGDTFRLIFDEVTSTRNAQQNKNVGRPQRHVDEMPLADQEQFLSRFRTYYERFLELGDGAAIDANRTTTPLAPGRNSPSAGAPVNSRAELQHANTDHAPLRPHREIRTALDLDDGSTGGGQRLVREEIGGRRINLNAEMRREQRNADRHPANLTTGDTRSERTKAARIVPREKLIAARQPGGDRSARLDAKRERLQEKAAGSVAKLEAKRERLEKKMASGDRAARVEAKRNRLEKRMAGEDHATRVETATLKASFSRRLPWGLAVRRELRGLLSWLHR